MGSMKRGFDSPGKPLGAAPRQRAAVVGMMRRAVAGAAFIAAAASLSGCGFHPLYATSDSRGGARAIFSAIYVEPIVGERVGYELRNALIDDLRGVPRPADATWRLSVVADQYIQAIAVANTAAITRYNYIVDAHYTLSDVKTGKVVKSGIESSLSAYDVVSSPYATLVAQRDAQRRGASDVASHIQIDLAAFFDRRSGA